MKLLVALAAVAALLAGCSGSGGESETPDTDAQGRYVIHMTAANRFQPADAEVPAGATVVWINDGGVHDVTAHDDSWQSPRLMPAGASYERKFDAPGTYEYHCDLHASQGMTATLRVTGDAPAGTGTATGTTTSAGTNTAAA